MSTIDDVRAKLEDLRDELVPRFREKIEGGEDWTPVCVSTYENSEENFLYLRYDGVVQRREVFMHMNEHLETTEAEGCVLILDTEYHPDDSDEVLDALYVSLRGNGVREMVAYPYRTTKDGEVKWEERVVGPTRTYENGFITAFATEIH